MSPHPNGIDDPPVRDEALIAELAKRLGPLMRWYFKLRVEGEDKVPAGPCIFVGNHNGGMLLPEMYLTGLALHDRFGIEAVPFGLAHKVGMATPLLRTALQRLGAVRGNQANGLRMLAQGHKVLCYPGGELDSMRSYRQRQRVCFGTRRGYIRLALRARVPIVPVVTAGAHETLIVLNDGRWLARHLRLDKLFGLCAWPLSLSFPWGLWLGVPPPHVPWRTQIKIAMLEPLRFDPDGEDAAKDAAYVEACHQQVHKRMESTLQRLSNEGEVS